jgi:hypothetical protein
MCNFPQSPVTSSFLGPDILLSALFPNLCEDYTEFQTSKETDKCKYNIYKAMEIPTLTYIWGKLVKKNKKLV